MALGPLYPYLEGENDVNNPYETELQERLRDHENAGDERELTRLITWATSGVLKYTRAAVYPTNEDSTPSDPGQRAAMVDAIEAQCATVLSLGLVADVLSGGAAAEPTLTGTSDNGASLSFSDAHAQQARMWLRRGDLTTEAQMILDAAGLGPQHPWIRY